MVFIFFNNSLLKNSLSIPPTPHAFFIHRNFHSISPPYILSSILPTIPINHIPIPHQPHPNQTDHNHSYHPTYPLIINTTLPIHIHQITPIIHTTQLPLLSIPTILDIPIQTQLLYLSILVLIYRCLSLSLLFF